MKKLFNYNFPFIIVLCTILLTTPAHAENFRFIHYEVEDGIGSNTVRSLGQDYRGFIWLGTENGLSRFDGYAFKTFRHIPGDSTSIGNNYIYSLFEDCDSVFWVGTDEGVYIHNPVDESFSFFDYETDKGVTIRSNITCITEDRKGSIWISTRRQGVFRFDKYRRQLYQYLAEGYRSDVTIINTVYSLLVDNEDILWAGTSSENNEILYKYDTGSDQFYPVKIHLANEELPALGDMNIYAISEDVNNNLWIGTWNYGLGKMNKQTGKTEFFLRPGTEYGAPHIHSIYKYSDDLLLIGSDDGLTVFNPYTGETQIYTNSELDINSLSNRFVYPIWKDREGGLWVGTYHGGVNYSPPLKGDIESYSNSMYQNSVGGNIISCFCEDEEGNIWIGSDDGGLSYFNMKEKSFTNYMPQPGKNSLSYHNIHALCIYDEKLWIGTYSGGLNTLDLKSGVFNVYLEKADNSIYSLYKDKEERLWAGTIFSINLYDKENDRFVLMQNVGTTTADILEDDEHYIWFATSGKGLYRYHTVSGDWDHYMYNSRNENSLSCNQTNCLFLDSKKRLWIGTDEGLVYYDKQRNSFKSIPLDIPSPVIYSIMEIDNYFWITTSKGLIQYHEEKGVIRILLKKDGLLSDQFSRRAGLVSSSGKLFLGTINGFNILDPYTVEENYYIPPLVLTNIQINNKDIPISNNNKVKISGNRAPVLELSHHENVFSLEYAALSYCNPSKNQYQYILDGFDKEWNHVGNQRKATYTNLPAGNYTFHVRGSNNDGIWNDEGISLRLKIHPPFWRSSLAYFIYILLLLATIGYFIHASRIRTEKKHRKKIRQLEKEKEKEIHDAKINFFTLIAHEIRTPVSLIIGPMEKIMENIHALPSEMERELKIINRNSQRLLSLVNQLLDFRKVEEKAFSVHFSTHSISELVQNVFDRFLPLATRKGITFTIENNEEPIKADVDAEAFTKIISNLLTNAIKYTKNEILIHYKVEGEHLIISVKDNGKGVAYEEQQQIFKPFYQAAKSHQPGTGLGLSFVQSLVEAHHGTIRVESIPGEYALFILTLPVKQTPEIRGGHVEQKEFLLSEDSLLYDLPAIEPAEEEKAFLLQTDKPVMLIIEDNKEMKQFLKEKFEIHYTILTAGHGKEGLNKLKRQPVDIIISDVMMPVMDGIAFCQSVKSNVQYSHIPLVLLTARTDIKSKLEGVHSGADLYIEKPFSPHLLQASIQNLLTSRLALKKKFSEMPFVPMDTVAVNKADEKFIKKLNDIIHKNISNESFSVEILAHELGISRSSLFTKLKHLVEMTPNELVQVVRLKKAAELLAGGEYRINEICYQVGFSNPSYFAKCFQKQFGVLPKDFTRKNDIIISN